MSSHIGLGLGTPLEISGVPTNGTSEVQTLTIGSGATGGTFRLSFEGAKTPNIEWSSTNTTLISNIQTALRALPTIGEAGVTVSEATMTSGIGTATIAFGGNRSRLAVETIGVLENKLEGSASLAVSKSTPGVDASKRGAARGAQLINRATGISYRNEGLPLEPNWKQLATEP
jgi:hypothetical protein